MSRKITFIIITTFSLVTMFALLNLNACAQGKLYEKIIVDKKGGADFTSIREAINNLADSSRESGIIFIKNGIYTGKIFVKKHNIIFAGEARNKTIITQVIGRRVYYFDCHKEGGDYPWFRDNLSSAPGSPSAGSIKAEWVFKNRWHPLSFICVNLKGAATVQINKASSNPLLHTFYRVKEKDGNVLYTFEDKSNISNC